MHPSPTLICTVTNDLSFDQRMIRICDSLARRAYDVCLVGRELPDSLPLTERGFRQHRLRCRFHRGKLFYVEYNLRLFFWLLRQHFDALYAVDLDTLLPAYLLSRLRARPCVYDAHEYFTELPEVVDRPLTRSIWRLLARLLIPRLRYAITVGPGLARILSDRYGTDFGVIRNLPYRQQGMVAPPSGDRHIVLYQGRLNMGRGLETAIRAMPLVPQAELWLAGEGDLSEELRALARQTGVADRVRFLGYVQPEELQALTLKAHIGLNLLENKGLSYYYSLANKAFDYIQAGLPSIQMDFPEYRALQQQHGVFHLLEELSADALALALQELIDHPDHWEKLHHHCLQARDELCWEREEARLWALLDKTLSYEYNEHE